MTIARPSLQSAASRARLASAAPLTALLARLLLPAMLWAGVPTAALAQVSAAQSATVASEERVKAAFLYKFLNYIEWPPAVFVRADAPYVIGVLGADPVADDLEQLVAGRRVNERPVAVRRLRPTEAVTGVHVVFVGRAERARLAPILRQVQALPVLVVTEVDGAVSPGSMINFRLADERVRFEVALDPVEKAGLKLDSRMLAVALSVNKAVSQ